MFVSLKLRPGVLVAQGWVLSTKVGTWTCVPQTWVAKSASLVYQWPFPPKFGVWLRPFLKRFKNLCKIGAHFNKWCNFHQKMLTESENFGKICYWVKIWLKIEAIVIWIYHFVFLNWYMYMGLLSNSQWVYFQILSGTSLLKPNLSILVDSISYHSPDSMVHPLTVNWYTEQGRKSNLHYNVQVDLYITATSKTVIFYKLFTN